MRSLRLSAIVLSLGIFAAPVLASPIPELQGQYQKLLVQQNQPQTEIPDGPTLKDAITHEHVRLLTQRLNELGYHVDETNTYNNSIRQAVTQFQEDRSINADGVVGNQTRHALNVGPEEALKLIEQSLSEWQNRFAAGEPNKYVVVNVPQYELIAYENGREVFRSRVIVGATATRTPMLTSNATSLKYNPDWTAPPGIASRYAQKYNSGNRAYFQKHGIRVSTKNGRLHFYQPPSSSYLGDLKVELDNKDNIYLHDTNSPGLYDRSVRALSNGCVRVKDYLKLAAWLSNTSEQHIQSQINTGRTHWEKFEPVPVYMVYMLAYPDVDGTIGYFDDVYGNLR